MRGSKWVKYGSGVGKADDKESLAGVIGISEIFSVTWAVCWEALSIADVATLSVEEDWVVELDVVES